MKRPELGAECLLACGHTGRFIINDYGICGTTLRDRRPYIVALDNAASYGMQIDLHPAADALASDMDVIATWYGVTNGPRMVKLVREGRKQRYIDVTHRLPKRVVACMQAGHWYGELRAKRIAATLQALRRSG